VDQNRRFGTTYRSHLQGSSFTRPLKMGPIGCLLKRRFQTTSRRVITQKTYEFYVHEIQHRTLHQNLDLKVFRVLYKTNFTHAKFRPITFSTHFTGSLIHISLGSSVNVVTSWRLSSEESFSHSCQRQGIFLFYKTPEQDTDVQPAATQSHQQLLPGRKANYWSPSSAHSKKAWVYSTSSSGLTFLHV
jgi:hypothetical protein